MSDVSKLSLINISSQFVSIVGFVLISKMFSLEAIGELSVVNAYVGIISLISTGYLENSLYIDDRNNIRELIKALLFMLILFTIILSMIVMSLLGVENLVFIAIQIFGLSLIRVLTVWHINNGSVFYPNIVRLILSPAALIFSWSMVSIYGSNSRVLLTGYVCAIILHTITLAAGSYFFHGLTLKVRKVLSVKRLVAVASRYRRFVFYSMPGELLRTLAFKGPTIAIDAFFSPAVAGLYGMANQLILLPISTIIAALSQLFMRDIGNFNKITIDSRSLVVRYMKVSFGLALIVSLVVVLIGEFLINFILGVRFYDLYDYVLRLLPYVSTLIIVSPVLGVYTIMERQKSIFIGKGIMFLASLASFYYGIILDDFLSSLLIFSTGLSLVYMFLGIMIIRPSFYDKEI